MTRNIGLLDIVVLPIANSWLKSYLSDREQFICINGVNSVISSIKYGAPQGSILGPLLFVIYINDIPSLYKIAKFIIILYADDANIIITCNNIAEIKRQSSDLIINLVSWGKINGMALRERSQMTSSEFSLQNNSTIFHL